ncbi:MAG TPA: HEPN domain-containing protein [Candidatus Hypogeohydataceae bacterium YC41]
MAKVDYLKKRAEEFLKGAKFYLEEGNYNLAAFNLEQVAQLYLKYYLFLKLRDYPKTHSLEELLGGLAKVYSDKRLEIEKILRKDASVIGDLEQAYLTSRYLPVEFSKNRVEKMQDFVKKLIRFLEKSCGEHSESI